MYYFLNILNPTIQAVNIFPWALLFYLDFIIYNFSMTQKKSFALVLSFVFIIASCSSTKNLSTQDPESPENEAIASESNNQEDSLSLVFAGDIMAHSPNFKITDFDRIWRDISPLVSSGDLAFANIEAPVADTLPWSTYPQFNMHSEYVEAAIKAGFNVFSLANNHTNDQSLKGMKETKKYFDKLKNIWACGLKEKAGDSLTYKIIEKKGWKVLFVAVTEILNSPDSASYIDYYPSTEKKREVLIEELKALQKQSKCDLFVVSIHTDEPEYIIKVTENHKIFFRRLIDECNADVIWANHPHVVKYYEEVNGSFIMYANGNTISAQRTNPQFMAPETARDYTGDGLIIKMKARKKAGKKASLSDFEAHLITTYITPKGQYVIKELNDSFIESLDRAEIVNWSEYLRERKKLVEKIQEDKN